MDPVGGDRTHRARGLYVDGAAGDLRLGPGSAGSSLPLAPVLHRGGVPVVHPAPEPDRAAGVLAVADAARSGARARARAGWHVGRLPAAARTGDPPHAVSAARSEEHTSELQSLMRIP